MQQIPFHKTFRTGREIEYLQEAVEQKSLVGDGPFTKRCRKLLEQELGANAVLFTPSCTAALEVAALLCKTSDDPGEVIIPGFTFVSTALAFVINGFKPVFVDIRESDCNIDPDSIRAAITPRTRVIVPVHYAGVSCDMDEIMQIAEDHNLLVVEDAAQACFSKHKDRFAGTIGHLGAISFHDTKNFSCGEGGAILVNDPSMLQRAERIREKGTNRADFVAGRIHKYTWVDVGSSYLMSDMQAAFLLAQIEAADEIFKRRRWLYEHMTERLEPLEAAGHLTLPRIPAECTSNYHLLHILLDSEKTRTELLTHLDAAGIGSAFHYLPLHLSPAGSRFGKGPGSLPVVESVAGRLLRLPLYPTLTDEEVDHILESVNRFFNASSSGGTTPQAKGGYAPKVAASSISE